MFADIDALLNLPRVIGVALRRAGPKPLRKYM